MMMMMMIMMTVVYFFLSLATYIIAKHLLRKIRNLPPSPFPELPILGHLYLLKKPIQQRLNRISASHGPVVHLQFGCRPVLLVSSPSVVEECLTKNDVIFANRPRLLQGKYLGYNYTSLTWAPYGDHWRNLRRIASLQILSAHRLQTLQSIRAEEVTLLVKRLAAGRRGETKTVDMKAAIFELMLNAIMRMISGKRYYGENVKEGDEGVTEFMELVAETYRVSTGSNVVEFLPFLRKIGFKGMETKLERLQEKREAFMKKLVEEHRRYRQQLGGSGADDGDNNIKKTLIQVLLSLQEEDPDYYNDVTIRSIILVIMGGATDTSSATTEWAMSLLLNNPEVIKKAQAEIDAVVGFDRLVNESDLANLPYLHCIITETLRLYPAASLFTPHESSDECFVGGYRVAAGTMLLINQHSIQRDPKYWSDPKSFKPERFHGLVGVRDGYKMLPFSAGRRGCPGENLALKMIGSTVAALLQCFDWARVTEQLEDMTEGAGLTMAKLKPLQAKCTPRQSANPLLSTLS